MTARQAFGIALAVSWAAVVGPTQLSRAQPNGSQPNGSQTSASEPEPTTHLELLSEDLWPTVSAEFLPAGGVSVGDATTLEITVVVHGNDSVSFPDQSLAPFELLSSDHSVEPEGDAQHHRFIAKLLALEPGTHTLALYLRVLTEDRQLGRVPIEPVSVEVRSLLANEPNAEPKAPTEPRTVLEQDLSLAWLAAALVAALLIGVLAFFLARWWLSRPRRTPPAPPPRPPWEVALEELARLREQLEQASDEQDQVALADALSDTVRRYLGDRFGFDGLESTTDEVIGEVSKRKPKAGLGEEIASLLGDLDLIKFAKAVPNAEQAQSQLACGVRIVRETRPSVLQEEERTA